MMLVILSVAIVEPAVCNPYVFKQLAVPKGFRLLAVEGLFSGNRKQSGQLLIQELLRYPNWNNVTNLSYIHLLSRYTREEVFDECKSCLVGNSTKANMKNEIQGFLANATSDELAILYFCSDGNNLLLGLDEVISSTELLDWLSTIRTTTCIVLDACKSGSWIDDGSGGVLSGKLVLASSRKDEFSYGRSPPEAPYSFGIFTGLRILHWNNGSNLPLGVIGGLASGTDSNKDDWISFGECFQLAKTTVQQYLSGLQNPVSFNGLGFDPLLVQLPSLVHDVAVTGIQCKNVTSNSTSTSIKVTVTNQGDFPELLNVTLYANTTAVAEFTSRTLLAGTSVTITLTWNTSGFNYGNYTITAYATPVPGETDTTDNTLMNWIVITIPGDIDGNFKVQLNDLVLLAHAYGSRSGDSNWNSSADIDDNGIVGLSDLVILAKNYGQG
jgi:hypothetical protein